MKIRKPTDSNTALEKLKDIGLVDKSFNFLQYSDEERRTTLASFSSTADFYDDNWFIDYKEPEMNFTDYTRTLKFGDLPVVLQSEIKDWVLYRMQSGKKLKGISSSLNDLKFFLKSNNRHVYSISRRNILQFYDELMARNLSDSTVVRRWNVLRNFFIDMECERQACYMETYILPKAGQQKKADKYIPEDVAKKLDDLFMGEEIPLAYKAIYWSLRLYPNRIEEVVSIKKDALVRVSDEEYLLTVPVSKTSGNYEKPEDKRLKIIYQGIGEFYIDLLLRQKAFTETNLPDCEYLFTTRKVCYKKDLVTKQYGYEETGEKVYQVRQNMVQNFFWRLGPRYNIKDNAGEYISIATHAFRHTAVTDRLQSGIFRRIDVMYETGHKNTVMIDRNYAHAKAPEKRPPEFRGKITSDARRVSAMLSRPFAKEIFHLGVCADVRDCKSDRISCLSCPHLRIDENYIPFMKSDRADWAEKMRKAEKIGNEPFVALCVKWCEAYDNLFDRIGAEDAKNG